MPTWYERVEGSSLVSQIDATLDLLEVMETDENGVMSRARTVLPEIRLRFLATNPNFIGEGTINGLEQQSSELLNSIKQHMETNQPQFLVQAQKNLHQLLGVSAALRPMLPESDRALIEDSIRPFQDAVSEQRRQISSLQADITRAEEKLQELQSNAKVHDERLANYEQDRQSSFTRAQQEHDTEFRGRLSEHETKFREWMNSSEEQGSTLLEKLAGYERRAEEIIGVTAAAGTVEAFQNEADLQRRNADRLRIVSFVMLGLAAAIAASTLVLGEVPGADAPIQQVMSYYGTRSTLLLAVFGIAGLAIRESGKHRSREVLNRRLANELTTFRPFLAELEDPDRQELVRRASDRYFPGHGINLRANATNPSSNLEKIVPPDKSA